MKKLGFLILLTTLTGCVSFFDGSFQSPSFATKDNFRIVKTIEGKAQATYVFGIGGSLRDGLVNEAKRNMYSMYPLKPNQNLTNITVDTKVTSFIFPVFYQSKVVFVSADVIEFFDDISGEKANESANEADNNQSKIMRDENAEITSEWKMVEPVDQKSLSTTEFNRISSFKEQRPATVRIANPKDLKIGDFVSFKFWNEDGSSSAYGVVQSLNGDLVKVKMYKSVGQFEIIEERYIHFKKVIY